MRAPAAASDMTRITGTPTVLQPTSKKTTRAHATGFRWCLDSLMPPAPAIAQPGFTCPGLQSTAITTSWCRAPSQLALRSRRLQSHPSARLGFTTSSSSCSFSASLRRRARRAGLIPATLSTSPPPPMKTGRPSGPTPGASALTTSNRAHRTINTSAPASASS